MNTPLPNRLALYLFAAASLCGALAPVVADFDFESTAGIAAALASFAAILFKWLDNWGKYERGEGQGLLLGELEDEFDEESAELPPAVVEAAHAKPPAT
jgi:hypothetical protein